MDINAVPIDDAPDYRRHLQHFVHSYERLSQAGYVMKPLSLTAIDRKRRCRRCHKAVGKSRPPRQAAAPSQSEAQEPEQQAPDPGTDGQTAGQGQEQPNLPCRFHPGIVSHRAWTCCRGPPFSKPCQGEKVHEWLHYNAGELEKEWKYFPTPLSPVKPNAPVAVAIDCEMGTAQSGESELIRISVIEFFSGKLLLDKLVYPHVRMAHFNTAFSGVTRKMMEDARRRNTCLFGRKTARAAVYDLIGPDTIVVGHGLQSDLSSLRWMHPLVVDTLIVETEKRAREEEEAEVARLAQKAGKEEEDEEEYGEGEVVPTQVGGLRLKDLARKRLNRVIQIKGRGHDSNEDALATRDLLHWHVCQRLASGEEADGAVMADIISSRSGRW
jgi:RNA exonuclease 1